ncbi:MAG: hypothetical protein RLZ98_3304 [Pseudomonadota bacterium]
MDTGKSAGADQEVPWRIQAAVYGIGLFSTSIFYIGSVIIPLYAYTLNPSPFLFGLVFSAAHFLPLFFSIHAGALMDRLGARRVLLFCTIFGAIVPLFYPLAFSIYVLILLQMLLGFAESMGWLGAQTLIGQYMRGKTLYAGRLSFFIRAAPLIAPPLAGVVWDFLGIWAAFILMTIWGSGAVVCALMLPPLPPGATPPRAPVSSQSKLQTLLPNLADYVTAFSLLARPAVVIVVLLSAMMHLGNSVQNSFYIAWLNEMGFTGTAIGLLSPIAAVSAALFSLVAVRLLKYMSALWILLISLWSGIVLICITPLLGTYFLLQVAMFLRSGANGLAQPLIITTVLGGAGRENQGKAIGLRATGNRVASILSPLIMGAVAELFGLKWSFFVIGIAVSIGMAAIAYYLWRRPDIASASEE